jgi:hypothetical protein
VLDYTSLPEWAVLAKRVITLLVLAMCGLHAYVQYRRRGRKLNTSERSLFFTFSLIFLFGTAVNFGAAAMTWKVGAKSGPFNYGEFSLLIALLYMCFNFGVGLRRRF